MTFNATRDEFRRCSARIIKMRRREGDVRKRKETRFRSVTTDILLVSFNFLATADFKSRPTLRTAKLLVSVYLSEKHVEIIETLNCTTLNQYYLFTRTLC